MPHPIVVHRPTPKHHLSCTMRQARYFCHILPSIGDTTRLGPFWSRVTPHRRALLTSGLGLGPGQHVRYRGWPIFTACGRSERVLLTVQDCLPKEPWQGSAPAMRPIDGCGTGSSPITTPGSRLRWTRRVPRGRGRKSYVCRKERTLGNDNTVKWERAEPAIAAGPVALLRLERFYRGARKRSLRPAASDQHLHTHE
jgi:hypothetical protein